MLGGGLDRLQLRARRGELRDGLLEIGVGHLVRVELRAVARQVEPLDLVLVLGKPCLRGLAVVHPQVVQDQIDLASRVLDQPAQEVDQDVGVERAVEGLPALPTRVPDGRKLRDLCFRGWVAAHLVGDDLARSLGADGEHALEEAFRCDLVASLLHQDVRFGAMPIDGAPQHVGLTAKRHEHLVQMRRIVS